MHINIICEHIYRNELVSFVIEVVVVFDIVLLLYIYYIANTNNGNSVLFRFRFF